MSDDGVSDHKDGDEDAANDQTIWSEWDEVEQSGVIYLFALVPFVLILTFLSQIAGDVVWKVGPPLLIAAFSAIVSGSHTGIGWRSPGSGKH